MIIFHSHLLKGEEIAKTVDKSPVLLITRLLSPLSADKYSELNRKPCHFLLRLS